MDETLPDEEKWLEAFDKYVKTKPFEQFSLLMLELKHISSQQGRLLHEILFRNFKSSEAWEKYITFVFEKFPEKKLHLQRLIYKALELIDEKSCASELAYLRIHLLCIHLKTNQMDKAKYFQNILWRRSIGTGFAELYLSWAKVAPNCSSKGDNMEMWDEDKILKKGIELNAQPIEDLRQNFTEHDSVSDHSDEATIKVPTQDLKQALNKIPVKRSRAQTEQVVKKKPKISLTSEDIRKDNIFLQQDKYFTLNGKLFFKLNTIGKGGSSTVFKVISATEGSLYALKTVDLSKGCQSSDFDDEDKVLESYMNEIDLLKSLNGKSPYIVELIDYQIFQQQKKLAILLELGDIDLAKLLSQSIKSSNHGANLLDPILVRMLWKEMLLAVHHIHENRIIHGDLKPANFVFIKGHLKLIDFGIAKSISVDTTNIYRDSQIGTINYMAPEAINPDGGNMLSNGVEESKLFPSSSMKVGRSSDIWSLGCILYQMIYGKPPFAHLNTIQKLIAIPNPNYEIQYPDTSSDTFAIETIKCCLNRNPRERAPIQGKDGLLNKSFLQFQSNNSERQQSSDRSATSRSGSLVANLQGNTVKSALPVKSSKLVLPSDLKAEIIQSENRLLPLESEEANAKASRWMKQGGEEAGGGMKSLLEKRMNQMRKFLDIEQDNNSTTESLNFSGFFSQL